MTHSCPKRRSADLAAQAGVRALRHHCASGCTVSADCSRLGGPGLAGAGTRGQVLRPSTAVSPKRDLCPAWCNAVTLYVGRLGGRQQSIAAPIGTGAASLCHGWQRSEEHTSELQSLMRISYAVFSL